MEDELAQYQGPALYAWNDAVFEKEDWQGLAKIEQSCKENEVLKIGRFGLGFLSVFHLTGNLYERNVCLSVCLHEIWHYRCQACKIMW